MGKKSAPKYAKTTYDTGNLYGKSTSDENGTTYSAPNWISNTMGTVGNNVNSTLQNMLSNDFSNDANFKAYQNQLNKTASQNYDTSVLSQLANRGLMRSSGLQSATNAFADTLADKTTDLYDNYYNRQANNLSNLLNTSNTLYNYITGVNSGSQQNSKNVSDYNLSKYEAESKSNDGLYSMLGNAMGSAAGLAATGGNPILSKKLLSGGNNILKNLA